MTNKELAEALRSKPKLYEGICTQPHFSRMCQSIEYSLPKPATIKAFAEKFGYTGDWNNWSKKDDLTNNQPA